MQKVANKDLKLSEVGPRFALTPTFIQKGFFEGKLLYTNPKFETISEERGKLRALQRKILQSKMNKKSKKIKKRKKLFQKNKDISDPEEVFE